MPFPIRASRALLLTLRVKVLKFAFYLLISGGNTTCYEADWHRLQDTSNQVSDLSLDDSIIIVGAQNIFLCGPGLSVPPLNFNCTHSSPALIHVFSYASSS